MPKKIAERKSYALEIAVFISGAVVLIFEILGSRVMGPYVGTSVYVWTSLIGVILGSLSFGYWLGGKYADRNPQIKTLSLIILLGAVSIFLTTLIKDITLELLLSVIKDQKWCAFFASLVLFAPTSILSGMVLPYAVKLKLKNLKLTGATVGNLHALSTVGSIMGTFLAGYVLIPNFGTTRVLFALAITLVLVSALLMPNWLKKTRVGMILLLFFSLFVHQQVLVNEVHEGFIDVDTEFNRIWIYPYTDETTQKPALRMRINNENSASMFLDSDALVDKYMEYYHLAEHFNPGFKKVVMFGGAAYEYPKVFLKRFPAARIDVVEIDPQVTALARKYFRLRSNPRLRIFHEDARTFLNRTEEKYDVILGDAFKSNYSLPFHLTTREAVQKHFDILNENGVAIVNLISAIEGEKGKFLQAEYATYKAIFPQVFLFPITFPDNGEKPQNIILIALKSTKVIDFENDDPTLNGLLKQHWKKPVPETVPVLTDDFAPIEHYVSKIFDDL